MTIRKNEKKIYPRPHDRQIVFLKKSGNQSLATYSFPVFFDERNLDPKQITDAGDNKGDITSQLPGNKLSGLKRMIVRSPAST